MIRHRAIFMAVAAAVLGCPLTQLRADEVADTIARAQSLSRDDRHQAALGELQAAYAQRQAPRLLFEIARAQQHLGLGAEAAISYRRYLAAAPAEEVAQRQVAETQLRRLAPQLSPGAGMPGAEQPYPAGAPWLGPPQLAMRPTRFVNQINVGLVAGGAVLLGLAYTGAVVTGSGFIGNSSSGSRGSIGAAAGTLLIPVAGPFIAALVYRDASWSIPIALIDGVAQAGGLAMIVLGTKYRRRVPVFERLQVTPYALAGGGGVVAGGKF